jgi:acetyltransferase-like isoleucine patch superfamily enzyme
MHNLLVLIFKSLKFIKNAVIYPFDKLASSIIFYFNNVNKKSFTTKGIPFVAVTRGGEFVIGNNFSMNNNKPSNPIGREAKCSFFVAKGAYLSIGDNVGMSSTAIFCQQEIIIEDFVKIGGNTCIYDTDFHSLDSDDRKDKLKDFKNRKTKPVIIKKNAFIGAHSTILKGVTIGENSIVGACSLVSKSIPPNQIWAGNPAKYIRNIGGGK